MKFEDFIEEWHNAAPYIIVRTSGSTGKPKEIQLEKEFVKESARRTNYFFTISSGSRLHSCVGADFIGGKMMAVRASLAGCDFTWEKPSNRPLGDLSVSDEITLLSVVPSQMIHILDNSDKMPVIRNFLIGGSAITPSLRKRIAESGLRAFESYGMTETASHIALRKIESEEGWFETLPGIEVDLDNRGCIVIRFLSGEIFVTNDMAVLRSSTNFKIKGRYDNVIITGGKKLHPEDLEKRISHLFESEFLISSEEDEKWGERIILIIEGSPSGRTEKEILSEVSKIVERWEVPKSVKWVDKLPRTPNGKILRSSFLAK
ncbi:MAG: AMP-binding protein [Muribaculaceae bacterium]|nr:AMP-binding protein [Muribaculaceae bacterium]